MRKGNLCVALAVVVLALVADLAVGQVLLCDDFSGTTIDTFKWIEFNDVDGGTIYQDGKIYWDKAGSVDWTGHGIRTVMTFANGGVYTVEGEYEVDTLTLSQGEGGAGVSFHREGDAREMRYYGEPLYSVFGNFNGDIWYRGGSRDDWARLTTKDLIRGTLPNGTSNHVFNFLGTDVVRLRFELDTDIRTIKMYAEGYPESLAEGQLTEAQWDSILNGADRFVIEEFRSWCGTDNYVQHRLDDWSLRWDPVSLDSGLVVYYPFFNDDTKVIDYSGNELHGTRHGDPGYSTGRIGMAIELDGAGDYVESATVSDRWDSWSVAAFIYLHALSDTQNSLIMERERLGVYRDLEITVAKARDQLYVETDASEIPAMSSEQVLEVGRWYHVAVTYDGLQKSIYIDGDLDSSQADSSAWVDIAAPISVGRHDNSSYPSYFNGLIDELRVYDRALSPTEVQRLAGNSPGCDNDADDDGVPDDQDLCPDSPAGVVVEPGSGCTIDQLVPCDAPFGTTDPWKNHGKYVSTLVHTVSSFLAQGLITAEEAEAIKTAGAESDCGRK
jgi:hypothetical protein